MVNTGNYGDRLSHARYVLETIEIHPDANPWFENLGFGQSDLADGFQILEAAEQAWSAALVLRADRIGAVDHKSKMFRQIRQRHSVVLQMARLLITDLEGRTRLGLKGRQPEAVDQWHGYAACFYKALLPKDMVLLETVGITPQRIQLMKDCLDESITATADAKAATAAAVAATQALKAAFKTLARLMGRISVLARLGEAVNNYVAVLLKFTTFGKSKRNHVPKACTGKPDQPIATASMWAWFDKPAKSTDPVMTDKDSRAAGADSCNAPNPVTYDDLGPPSRSGDTAREGDITGRLSS